MNRLVLPVIAAMRRARTAGRQRSGARSEGRPVGDSPELHDEISPHDLPKDHPGRHAAERQAARSRTHTTRGGELPSRH
jgi:hypothetical protein